MFHNTLVKCVTELPVCAPLTFKKQKFPGFLVFTMLEKAWLKHSNGIQGVCKAIAPLWGAEIYTHTHTNKTNRRTPSGAVTSAHILYPFSHFHLL